MTHEELLEAVDPRFAYGKIGDALRVVIELHKPYFNEGLTVGHCKGCQTTLKEVTRHVSYPCPTIQAIEKGLQ